MAQDNLDDFRITSTHEITAMLKRLADGNIHITLNAPNGTSITATVWIVDEKRQMVSLSVLPDEPQLEALIECDEVTVVGYLDSIKVQFDVTNLMLVHSDRDRALTGTAPKEIFRFQRRNSFRVQPMVRSTPAVSGRRMRNW